MDHRTLERRERDIGEAVVAIRVIPELRRHGVEKDRTMTDWTPGPWKFGHTMGDRLWVGPEYDKAPVALVDWDSADARHEARFNARLIAAAPDLAEALQWMIDEFDADEFGSEGQMQTCHKARMALAKARGETA